MDALTHYKVECTIRGRKIKELGDKMGMDYYRLSRILNGFAPEPPDFGLQVRSVLAAWDEEVTMIRTTALDLAKLAVRHA